MTYDFHPEAQLEYRDAAGFYENRQPGLGTAFTLAIEETIRRILEAPERWRIIGEDVRRCLTRVFPYGILYTVEQNSVVIIAVMHLSRRPGYWRSRLR